MWIVISSLKKPQAVVEHLRCLRGKHNNEVSISFQCIFWTFDAFSLQICIQISNWIEYFFFSKASKSSRNHSWKEINGIQFSGCCSVYVKMLGGGGLKKKLNVIVIWTRVTQKLEILEYLWREQWIPGINIYKIEFQWKSMLLSLNFVKMNAFVILYTFVS